MKLKFEDIDTYELLIEVCQPYGFVPSHLSQQHRVFFDALFAEYSGESNKESVATWLEEKISTRFITLSQSPEWIQSPDWPFEDNQPMIFAGQIDILLDESDTASDYLHDDTSIYVFLGKESPAVVIIQQY